MSITAATCLNREGEIQVRPASIGMLDVYEVGGSLVGAILVFIENEEDGSLPKWDYKL